MGESGLGYDSATIRLQERSKLQKNGGTEKLWLVSYILLNQTIK